MQQKPIRAGDFGYEEKDDMSTEPDAWLLKQINSPDVVKRLIAVKMSLGLQYPKDYGLKMFNAVLDAENEINRLRAELAAKNRLLNDYARMSAIQQPQTQG